MKSKHTPGPWAVFHSKIEGTWIDPTGINVQDLSNGDANADRIVACVNACERIANPEVIPVMVELLRTLANVFDGYDGPFSDNARTIRDVLVKALDDEKKE